MSLRTRDTNNEIAIGKYLDAYFYPNNVTAFNRFSHKEDQLKGIDVRFSIESLGLHDIIVDEKAQVHYINKNLPTFAFELSFLTFRKERVGGWLLDDGKLTQCYLLIWVWAKSEKDIVEKDITKLECLLIERKKIIDFLETSGYPKAVLNQIDKDIRANSIDGAANKKIGSDIYFFSSKKLSEEPINVIIKKRKLIELAARVFTVLPS